MDRLSGNHTAKYQQEIRITLNFFNRIVFLKRNHGENLIR